MPTISVPHLPGGGYFVWTTRTRLYPARGERDLSEDESDSPQAGGRSDVALPFRAPTPELGNPYTGVQRGREKRTDLSIRPVGLRLG